MKKMNKLVSLATAATFLVSSFSLPALAATDQQVNRLNGLSIVQGYPDGTFGLDKNITRAEFAVIAVKLLGLGDAVDGAKGATKFKDVPAAHWASGAINLAVGNGVIKGYPDGNFKPEANVTLAEATAMLVQVLGYGPSLQGTWPNNVMGKGSEIGLLKGVSVTDFNAPATRGSVFGAADNALDIDVMKQTAFGSDPKWEVQNNLTLLQDKLNFDKVKDVTIDKVPISDTTLDADEIHITGAVGSTGITGNYKVVGNFDPNQYLGLSGTAWLNTTDDEIMMFESDDTLVADVIDAKGVGTITLNDKDKTYNVDGNTKVYINYVAQTNGDITGLSSGMFVNAVLDGSKISAIYAYNLNTGIVDRVDASNDKIYLSEPSGTVSLDDTYTIVKDGKAISLSDLKAGMLVDYNASTDATYIRVSDKTVTGKLSAVNTGDSYTYGTTYKLTIGDKTYKTIANGNIEYSTNDGKDYEVAGDISDFKDINGKDVTAYLDSLGRVAFVKAGSANETADDAVLIKEFTSATDANGTNWYVRVMKPDGTEAYYKMDDDTTLDNSNIADPSAQDTYAGTNKIEADWTGAAALTAGNVVKISLSSDGTVVDNFDTYATDEITAAATATKNEDNATITLATTPTKLVQVQSDTKFFTVKNFENNTTGLASGIKDAKAISWSDVKGTYADNFGGATLKVVYDGAKAKFVFINSNAVVTSDMTVGVLASKGLSGSDKVLNVTLPSATSTVKYSSWTGLSTKTLVYYKADSDNEVDGTVDTATPITTSSFDRYYVKSISSGADNTKILTLRTWDDTTKVMGTTDIEILVKDGYTNYFNCDSTPAKADSVGVGDHIRAYDVLDSDGKFNGTATVPGDGIVDYVLIQDKL